MRSSQEKVANSCDVRNNLNKNKYIFCYYNLALKKKKCYGDDFTQCSTAIKFAIHH